jgi:hypothetical protein
MTAARVMSERGLPGRLLGKTSAPGSSEPLNGRAWAMTFRASALRGTRCWRPAFILVPASVQTFASRSNSPQVAPLTSPDLAAVRTANRKASAPIPSADRSSDIKSGTSFQGRAGVVTDAPGLGRRRQKVAQLPAPRGRVGPRTPAMGGRVIKDRLDSLPRAGSCFRLRQPDGRQGCQDVVARHIPNRLPAEMRVGVGLERAAPLLAVLGVPKFCFLGRDPALGCPLERHGFTCRTGQRSLMSVGLRPLGLLFQVEGVVPGG